MKTFTTILFCLIPLFLNAQPGFQVMGADHEFYNLIPRDVKLEKADQKFQFTEGPVWSIRDKCLLFSDIPADKIYKWESPATISVFRSDSKNSNGLAFDNAGNLYACEHSSRCISLTDRDGNRTILVSSYRGKRLNSPNDLAINSSGAVFFTDPPWGLPKNDKDPAKELPFNGVFVFRNNHLFLIDSTLDRPNGIALSPDEKFLFVGNNQLSKDSRAPSERAWFRYMLDKNFHVTEKVKFLTSPDKVSPGDPDGMKIDSKGNFYCTGPAGLLIFNKDGKYLGIIKFPELPSNCAFGDADRKTLYVTARTSVYKIRVLVPGK